MSDLEQAIDATLGAWVEQNGGRWASGLQPGRPDDRSDLQARVDALRARIEAAWCERQAEEQ